ncbi:MAG: hypothetical protein QM765_39640 [Myxococcales bacterium]
MKAATRWLLATAALLPGCIHDPAPGLLTSKASTRSLECTRITQERAAELYPAEVPEPPARGYLGLGETDALVCSRRFLSPDERPARDEAILSSLSESAAQIAHAVAPSGQPSAANRAGAEDADLLWHVDAYYPEPGVAEKIAVAARMELAQRGRRVSDRVPLLAAGDILVVGRLPARKAYPLACARYFAEHALSDSEAFLGVMILDSRETQLHAGTCVRGQWRWLL